MIFGMASMKRTYISVHSLTCSSKIPQNNLLSLEHCANGAVSQSLQHFSVHEQHLFQTAVPASFLILLLRNALFILCCGGGTYICYKT